MEHMACPLAMEYGRIWSWKGKDIPSEGGIAKQEAKGVNEC